MPDFILSNDNQIRGDQLASEITDAMPIILTGDDIIFRPPRTITIAAVPDALVSAVQSIVSDHIPQVLYFESDYDRFQRDRVAELVKPYLAGLNRLSIEDFGYAYMARLLAKANGEDDQVILSIVDRATATSYVLGMSQWQNLTAAQRQWLAVDLESRAYDAMVIRLLLVD